MMIPRAAVIVVLFSLVFVQGVLAQDVTLTSRDGAVEISGTLLGFDGEFYRVETDYGELTLDGSAVVCSGSGCPDRGPFIADVRISGARSMGNVLIPALLEAFAARLELSVRRTEQDANHFHYILSDKTTKRVVGRFSFRLTNTDEGFADLLANEADIALARREVREDEVARGIEAGLGDLSEPGRSRIVALDGLVPVVAVENPVRAVSLADLSRVFSGEISNWQELGGEDAKISLHSRGPASGLQQGFEDRVLAFTGAHIAPDTVRHVSNRDLTHAVAEDRFAIGVTGYSEVGDAEPVALTDNCGSVFEAAQDTLKTEDYPLTTPLFIYTPARRLPKLAQSFLAYTRSPAAHLVVRRAGFVDQGPVGLRLNAQGERLANAISAAGEAVSLEDVQRMVRVMRHASRLTTTFRFEGGSSTLDAQSRSNVLLLARALESGIYNDRGIIFVGFSDGVGDAGKNLEIARTRAEAVQAAVEKALISADTSRVDLTVDAFGEALPMACDDTEWGREVNRRVEVWLR